VCGAHLLEGVCQLVRREQAPGIAAEQGEIDPLRQVVPQALEFQRGVVVPARAQQRHHLAEGMQVGAAGAGIAHEGADHLVETAAVRPTVDHEACQRRLRIQAGELAGLRHGAALRERAGIQAPAQRLAMVGSGDHDALAVGGQGLVDESRDFVEQHVIVVIETDEMPVFSVFPGQNIVGLDQHVSSCACMKVAAERGLYRKV